MRHRLTHRSRNPTGKMCQMLKSTLSMVVISRWTRLQMKSPHSSKVLSVLRGGTSPLCALARIGNLPAQDKLVDVILPTAFCQRQTQSNERFLESFWNGT